MVGKQKVRECIMEAWKRQNGNDQRSLVERFGSVRRSLGRWKRDCSNNSKERLSLPGQECRARNTSKANLIDVLGIKSGSAIIPLRSKSSWKDWDLSSLIRGWLGSRKYVNALWRHGKGRMGMIRDPW
ncbi:hypothetical protein DY000_02029538 [Brassica cretica]|uniref:Uncharacterized protein n=1 Tax=Brassica cretica TaxID=69181 RepID=A0ABQ7DWT0_BRACR|nr:hypothetical protein DY000_02029538 [Brassica cretica]